MIRRGEIWWADLGSPRGSAPALRRPILVISADFVNKSRLATISVVALTSNVRWAPAPGNLLVPAGTAGLDRDSVVNATQILTIDRSDLDARLGKLPQRLLSEVDAGLRRVLDL